MNIIKKAICLVAAALLGLAVLAADPMNAQSQVEPGVWCSDYTAAKAYADANGVPMLVFWANPSCHYCELMEEACKTAEFTAWQANRRFVMVFSYGDSAVKKIVKNDSNEYPYMMIYWANPGQTTLQERFTGKAGRLPEPAVATDALQKQLMDVMDDRTAGWDPDAKDVEGYCGGEFVVPDTDKARLEVLSTATSVIVPLTRTNGYTRVATNRLIMGSWSQNIAWAKGEHDKYVRVPLSGLTVGDQIELVLETEGAVHAKSAVHVVAEPENSARNPKWLGESFDFGEWTMDLAAAKAKTAAASGNAATLVFITGSLWCPWCLALENNVLDTDEFRAMMKENQVSLALIDETKRSPYDSTSKAPYAVTTVANGAAPTLLRYAVGANGASGASYLSRKGIGHEEAEAKLLANTLIGYPGGELCAPGAFRSGYPTFVLLDKMGAIKARFVYQADSSEGKDEQGAYKADKDENLQRFRDFVALAANDAVVENDKFYSTTRLEHAIGTSTGLKLQVCHNVNSYRLSGANSQRVTFRAAYDSANRGVTFAVVKASAEKVSRKDGDGIAVDTVSVDVGTVVASGVGELTCEFPATGEYYLKVSSFADYLTAKYGSEGTETQIVFMSEAEPIQTDNEYLGTAFTTTFPITEEGSVVGMLSVTATKSNRVTSRYTSLATGKTKSYVGKWGEPDEFGKALSRVEKKDATVDLSLAADGTINAQLTGLAFGDALLVGSGCVAPVAYAEFAGYYTVAVPVEHSSSPELEPTGSGTVVIKADSSSFLKSGSLTCSVVFPNGVTATGRGNLSAGQNGFANLTIYVKSGKDRLVLPMSIRPRASEAPTHRAVQAQDGLSACWVHDQKGFAFAHDCGIYGSYYNKKESLLDCCGTDALEVGYESSLSAPSTGHGSIVSIAGTGAPIEVTATRLAKPARVTKFSIKATHATGVVSGKALVYFADGASTSAQFRGVILPDWRDCGCFEEDDELPLAMDIPFVYGTLYFTDKIGKIVVKRSIPFGLYDAD